jgi:hypothetical protein
MFRKLALTAALLAPISAAAQDLPTAPYLPLDMATTAAQAALAACAAEKHNVSVAIVARDGSTKVLLKADNSGPHTGSSATARPSPRPPWAATPPTWPASLPRPRRMPACATWMTAW